MLNLAEKPNLYKIFVFWCIGVSAFFTDILTKNWIFSQIALNDPKIIIHNFFFLTPAENTGGVFSLGQGAGWVFALLSIIISVVVVGFHITSLNKTIWLHTGLGLISGGAWGNIYDRLRFGSVRDFLDVHFGSFDYPIFNVADIFICAGTGLVILTLFREDKKLETASDE